MGVLLLGFHTLIYVMKHLLFIISLLVFCSCTQRQADTSWEIEKKDGTKDTIIARQYWILTPDTQMIKFEVNDTSQVIYNRSGVVSFRQI